MFRVYYNSNPNLPKTIIKGKKEIITNHIGKRQECLTEDFGEFANMLEAVSFLRECSYPITKEYEITGFEEDFDDSLLLDNECFVNINNKNY